VSLISINQGVVEISQNQVVTIGEWKFQKSCRVAHHSPETSQDAAGGEGGHGVAKPQGVVQR
jgi:hypothetical protein